MTNLNSIKILGEGTISSGEYDTINICGEAYSSEHFKCRSIKVTGRLVSESGLTAEKIKLLGEVLLKSTLKITDNLYLLGVLKSESNSYIDSFKILGQGIFNNDLSFNKLEVLGELSVEKNCEGNNFSSKGKVTINGLLSADYIKISPNDNCVINEIGGSFIEVKKHFLDIFNFKQGKLISRSIEGDTIYLENTVCKVVRGHNVTILSGSRIDKVEYTGNLVVENGGFVGEKICLKN